MLGVDRDSQFIGPGPDSGEQEAARQNETAPQINLYLPHSNPTIKL